MDAKSLTHLDSCIRAEIALSASARLSPSLMGSEEALGDGIVVADAGAAHAELDRPGSEQGLVGVAGIPPAAVGMAPS